MKEVCLIDGEAHPSAISAFKYVKDIMINKASIVESIASTSLSGNRNAEVCLSTIRRIQTGQTVSDRYVLGLAWLFQKVLEKDSH
ncbi:MAG: hypothetical protein QM489_00545 [Candidatus Izemoplasma sp.]